jgi:capsular polysaccharide biosynthesis protein
MQENVNERAGGIDIDLKELLLTYLRRWWVILICLVVGASIAFGVTYQCVTPLYQARISIYVNNNKSIEEKEYLSSADLSAAQRLVNTYVSIAKSNRVLQEISETLNGEYSLGWLKRSLSASQLDGTEIFCIYVLHEDPKEAARIANAAAEVAPVEIAKIIEGTSAQVVDTARVPTSRYSPNYSRMALLGGALGALVAVVFLTIHYLNDTRIKDENDLAALYPLPVLGRIPDFDLTSSGKSYGYGKNSGYGNTEAKEAEAQK